MKNSKKRKNSQKHFRRIPKNVQVKVDKLENDNFLVSCVRKITMSEILDGDFSDLAISATKDEINFPNKQIPSPSIGRYSRINSQGKVLVRSDLPKVSKSFTREAPNFGDWTKGSHTVTQNRDVYQREFFPPKDIELEIELLGEEVSNEKIFILRFTLSEVLDRKKIETENQFLIKNNLFFNLNLLQECVGSVDVYPTSATRDDYLGSLYVTWEILPVGEKESTINRILSGVKTASPEIRKTIAERYDLLTSLNFKDLIYGVSGLRRYFGAKFSDNLVVFEHLDYGNAMYVMFEDWKSLSQLSRPQLLNGDRIGFERIIHKNGWEQKLIKLLDEKTS